MLNVITGSQGFVGKALVERLQQLHLPYLATTRLTKDKKSLQVLNGICHFVDLSKPESLIPKRFFDQPFRLIHLAWCTGERKSFQANAAQVHHLAGLLDYWTGKGLSEVIALGSAEEYAEAGGKLSDRSVPHGNFSPYGWGKRTAYHLVKSWAKKSDIKTSWLRPFIIYGPGQQGNMLIPYAIEKALNNESGDFTDGKQQRDFLYIDDLIDAVANVISIPHQGFKSYQLGNGSPIEVCEILQTIHLFGHCRSEWNYGAIPRRPGEPVEQYADIRRTKKELKWRPKIDFEEGINLTLQWARKVRLCKAS
ncbi:Hypothetical protein PBC10988_7260 [Planctomycetales bacterium 10988]|nr:Hypothetical protein PBC10988_7260 [Planctomycetales bacterium 10988]